MFASCVWWTSESTRTAGPSSRWCRKSWTGVFNWRLAPPADRSMRVPAGPGHEACVQGRVCRFSRGVMCLQGHAACECRGVGAWRLLSGTSGGICRGVCRCGTACMWRRLPNHAHCRTVTRTQPSCVTLRIYGPGAVVRIHGYACRDACTLKGVAGVGRGRRSVGVGRLAGVTGWAAGAIGLAVPSCGPVKIPLAHP